MKVKTLTFSFWIFGLKKKNSEIFHETVNVYDRIDRLVEPRLPVKYPRLLGHRPTAEEDPLNAWYVIHVCS